MLPPPHTLHNFGITAMSFLLFFFFLFFLVDQVKVFMLSVGKLLHFHVFIELNSDQESDMSRALAQVLIAHRKKKKNSKEDK